MLKHSGTDQDFVRPTMWRAYDADVTIRWRFTHYGKRYRPIVSTGPFIIWEDAIEREGVPVTITSTLIGMN